MRAGLAAAALLAPLLAAGSALGLESTAWPPPPEVLERMQALQRTLRDTNTSMEQRDAAREELARLLKSPAGQSRKTPAEKSAKAPRAAIDPFPSVVKPTNIAPKRPPPEEGVAKLEVIEPPKPTVDPRTGSVLPPVGQFAIDSRTGAVLHGSPAGYVDPRTGRFVPK